MSLVNDSDAAWERYGRLDPYFGVLTNERYKRETLSEGTLAEFFRSGEEQISSVISTIQDHIDKDFQPTRALDFGCGVGRLTIPLSRLCSHVVGVDVSDSMLSEARENCYDNGVTNASFIRADDRLSKVQSKFDLVLSFIVFQHISPRRGKKILEAILNRLETNGVGVLHLTYFFRGPRSNVRDAVHWARKHIPLAHNFVNLIQRKPFFYPLMQRNNYNLNDVHLLLQEQGCQYSYIEYTDHGGHLGVIVYFQRRSHSTS